MRPTLNTKRIDFRETSAALQLAVRPHTHCRHSWSGDFTDNSKYHQLPSQPVKWSQGALRLTRIYKQFQTNTNTLGKCSLPDCFSFNSSAPLLLAQGLDTATAPAAAVCMWALHSRDVLSSLFPGISYPAQHCDPTSDITLHHNTD